MTSPTEGLKPAQVRIPFLKRNLSSINPTNAIMNAGLEIKICVNTYKMFFVADTEDFYLFPKLKIKNDKENRSKKWKIWWESHTSNNNDVEMGNVA